MLIESDPIYSRTRKPTHGGMPGLAGLAFEGVWAHDWAGFWSGA